MEVTHGRRRGGEGNKGGGGSRMFPGMAGVPEH